MTGPDLNPSAPLGSPAPTGHALAAEATLDVTGADLDRLLLRREAVATTPPQALAARMDGDAARYRAQADLASRVLNATALNYAAGRSDGALAAASEVTQVLGPKWDALAAERDEAREERRKLMTALNVAFLYLGDDGSTAVREALEATT